MSGYIPNIKSLGLMVPGQEDFSVFPPIQAYVKHVTPGMRSILAPEA